jgi:hypothetical protein
MLSIWRRMKGSEATMKNLLLNLRKVSDAVSIDWNGLASKLSLFICFISTKVCSVMKNTRLKMLIYFYDNL